MSTFCEFYVKIRKIVDRQKPWDKKVMNGKMKREWARLSCGNIGKVEKKIGYKSWSCRICGKEDESLNHIWMCEDARKLIMNEWVKEFDEWREEKIGRGGGGLTSRLLRQL